VKDEERKRKKKEVDIVRNCRLILEKSWKFRKFIHRDWAGWRSAGRIKNGGQQKKGLWCADKHTHIGSVRALVKCAFDESPKVFRSAELMDEACLRI
jgi:hypothetical protein